MVNWLLTVFGALDFNVSFRCWISASEISSSFLSPNNGIRCVFSVVRFAAMLEGFGVQPRRTPQ